MGGINTAITYYDNATDPSIIIEQAYNRMWGFTKDEAPLLTLLNTLPRIEPTEEKKCNFAIGDYYQQALTLASAVVPNTATEITFTSTGDFLFADDIVRLFLTASKLYATLRITSKVAGEVGKYRFKVLSTNDTGTTSFTASGTNVKLQSSAVSWHGDARQYLNKKGDIGINWAQRSRDTVGKSDFEEKNTLADNSREGVVKRGWQFYNNKLETSLFTMDISRGGVNEADEYSLRGGLPYFLNPHDATFSETNGVRTIAHKTFWGQNKVVKASAFTFKDLRNWFQKITQYGRKDKILLLNDTMYELFYELIENNVGIQRADLNIIAPELPFVWETNRANFGFGTAYLMRCTNANDIEMVVKDDTNAAIVCDPLKWMVAIDLDHIGIRPYVNNKGVGGTPHIAEIATINNGSVDKIEFDSAFSLVITEPRAMGYFGLDTSA